MTTPSFLLFRFLTSLIFFYAGIKHLTRPEGILKRVANSATYAYINQPYLFKAAILISGIIMIAGALMLVVGFKTRMAAMLLLSIIITITLATQLEDLKDLVPFFKNIAIMGSLLLIINNQKNEIKKYRTDNTYAASELGGFCAENNIR